MVCGSGPVRALSLFPLGRPGSAKISIATTHVTRIENIDNCNLSWGNPGRLWCVEPPKTKVFASDRFSPMTTSVSYRQGRSASRVQNVGGKEGGVSASLTSRQSGCSKQRRCSERFFHISYIGIPTCIFLTSSSIEYYNYWFNARGLVRASINNDKTIVYFHAWPVIYGSCLQQFCT